MYNFDLLYCCSTALFAICACNGPGYTDNETRFLNQGDTSAHSVLSKIPKQNY